MSGAAKASICRICKENCGILVTENGRGIEIQGNPEHPISRGFICFRGKNFPQVHQSPDRLTHPLLRRGSSWEKISFEDALGILASELQKCKDRYGPESVVFYKGESLKHQEIAQYMSHLSRGFGSPNTITVGSLCHQAMAMAFGLTIGGIPLPDFKRMKTAVIWGANPAVALQRTAVALRKAVQNGTRLLVIDPARSRTAELADLHLPINPGSDGLLALAFIKYAVEKIPSSPRPSAANGWDELVRLAQKLSYNELLEKTGISRASFDEAASLIFQNLPGWIQTGSGLELQPCGFQTIRAIASLQSILDPENRPSLSLFGLTPLPGMDRYPQTPPPIGQRETPLYTKRSGEGQGMYLTRAILQNDPYPVRAMLVAGGNPLLTYPGSELHEKAFSALDFLAVFDLFMTPTAKAAHLVLPSSDFLENLELHDYGQAGHPRLGLVRPVVSDITGWPAWKLIFELARSLGLGDLFPWTDNVQALTHKLSESGLALGDLLKSPSATVAYTPPRSPEDRWSTPDGKVHYTSNLLDSLGYPALPEPGSLQLPLLPDHEYPFWLSTGDRVSCFQHSQFREIPAYRAMSPEPSLDIHPDAAVALGVASGDMVVISTRSGKIDVRANLSPDMRKDCLRLTHGWTDANANALTDSEYFDPVSGFPWMRALPAKVESKRN